MTKNQQIIDAWNNPEPSDTARERMLENIVSRANTAGVKRPVWGVKKLAASIALLALASAGLLIYGDEAIGALRTIIATRFATVDEVSPMTEDQREAYIAAELEKWRERRIKEGLFVSAQGGIMTYLPLEYDILNSIAKGNGPNGRSGGPLMIITGQPDPNYVPEIPKTFAEIQKEVPFEIMAPTYLPARFFQSPNATSVYDGYPGLSVILGYDTLTRSIKTLWISQSYVGKNATLDLRTTYPLEHVKVGDVDAVIVSSVNHGEGDPMDNGTWVNTYLFWIKDGYFFEMNCTSITNDELIAIAESMTEAL